MARAMGGVEPGGAIAVFGGDRSRVPAPSSFLSMGVSKVPFSARETNGQALETKRRSRRLNASAGVRLGPSVPRQRLRHDR